MFVLGATAQIVLITVMMAPLTYVTAALNLPLQDANLYALDRMLGLDWGNYVLFVDAHPALSGALSYAYTMIRWPIFAIPVLLAAIHHYRRLEEFTLALASLLSSPRLSLHWCPRLACASRSGSIPPPQATSSRPPVSITCAILRLCARVRCATSICSPWPAL